MKLVILYKNTIYGFDLRQKFCSKIIKLIGMLLSNYLISLLLAKKNLNRYE